MEDSENTKKLTFEDLLVKTGGTGTFQITNFFILALLGMFAVESIYINFIAVVVPHWCNVKELQHLPFDVQKNVAIPSDDKTNWISNASYGQCQMFNLNYSAYTTQDFLDWNRQTEAGNNTPIDCTDGWTYDKSQFASSIVSEWDLVCNQNWKVPFVSTAYNGGMFFGGVIAGIISDRFGRRPALVLSMVIKLIGGILSAFSPNYAVMLVTRFIIGFGSTAVYLLTFVLMVEVCVGLARAVFSMGLAVGFSFGYMLVPVVAFAVRDFRKLSLIMSLPSIIGLILWWIVPESPRWLLRQGRNTEAEKVIRNIGKINKCPLPDDFDLSRVTFDDDEKREALPKRNILDLFRTPQLRKWTLIIYLHWFTDSLLYYAMSLNSGSLAGDIFLNTLLLGLVEIPANILLAFAVEAPFLGRRLTCSLSLLFVGATSLICIPLIVTGVSPAAVTALSIIGKGAATMAFSGAYLYTGEIFPTEVRNVAMGSASTCGRISGMAAPFVGGLLGRPWKGLPYLVYAVFGIITGLLALQLPETLGKPLCDTIEEAENRGNPVKEGQEEVPNKASSSEPQKLKDYRTISSDTQTKQAAAYDNAAYTQQCRL